MRWFGIDLLRLSVKDPKGDLLRLLDGDHPSQAVTLNPEMALAARTERSLGDLISRSAIILADGAGVQWAASWLLGHSVTRMTGVDALEALLSAASERRLKVVFLGGGPQEGERAAQAALRRFPGADVISLDPGQVIRDADGAWRQPADLVERVQAFAPAVLAVAFGHGKQERWIADHLSKLPSVRVAIGVGGTFAFLSGRIRRAPAWMRRLGMEWAWRLIQEPRRIGRILRAVVVFPVLVIWDRILWRERPSGP